MSTVCHSLLWHTCSRLSAVGTCIFYSGADSPPPPCGVGSSFGGGETISCYASDREVYRGVRSSAGAGVESARERFEPRVSEDRIMRGEGARDITRV